MLMFRAVGTLLYRTLLSSISVASMASHHRRWNQVKFVEVEEPGCALRNRCADIRQRSRLHAVSLAGATTLDEM